MWKTKLSDYSLITQHAFPRIIRATNTLYYLSIPGDLVVSCVVQKTMNRKLVNYHYRLIIFRVM